MTSATTEAPTYPPERHAIRDLDVSTCLTSRERSVSAAPVTAAVRDAAGGAALGFLTGVVDVSAALVALVAAQPDWTATADLALHHVAPIDRGPVVVESRLVRAGSNIVVVGCDVFDGAGRDLEELLDTRALAPAARSIVTFARIPSRASTQAGRFDPAANIGTWRRMGPDAAEVVAAPMLERIGLRVVDAAAGVVEIDQSPYVANSFGTINGGVLGMVFQGAAEAAVSGFVAVDVQIHYLSQSKRGPARTSTTHVRRTGDHAVCTIDLVDAGNDDRLLAHATVTLLAVGTTGG
jgi:acyl-coenzyme A thioesterase PaaI-like protein